MSDYAITYTNARGNVVLFDDMFVGHVLRGPVLDTHLPPVRHASQAVFGQPGGVLTNTRIEVREVTVQCAVFGQPGEELHGRMRGMASALNPLLGDGLLRVERGDVSRELTCRYQSGFEGMQFVNDWGPIDWWEGDITFVAFDPYWQDGADHVVDWTISASSNAFFAAPFFPLNRLGAGNTFAAQLTEVTGDAPAWPVWTITGPCDDPRIEDATTGATIDLSDFSGLSLADHTEQVIIDTRPGYKTVHKYNDGVFDSSAFAFLTNDSSLFALAPGEHNLLFTASNTSGATALSLTYRQRHLSP